jgi:ribosomal protein L18E
MRADSNVNVAALEYAAGQVRRIVVAGAQAL